MSEARRIASSPPPCCLRRPLATRRDEPARRTHRPARGARPPRRAGRRRAAPRSPRVAARRVHRRLRDSTASRTRRSSSASPSASPRVLAAACVVIARRLVVTERARGGLPRPRAPGRARTRSRELVEESGERVHPQAARRLAGAGAAGRRSASRRSRRSCRSARVDSGGSTRRPGGAAAGSSDEQGRPLAARRDRSRGLLHRLPGGRRPRADRRAGRRRPVARELDCRRPRLGAAGHPRLLEDLHPCGLRDLALPHADLPAEPQPSPRSCAPATTRPSTRPTGGKVLFGPAGRPLPQLPLEIDRDGQPPRRRQLHRPRRPVVVGRALAQGDIVIRGARSLPRPAHGQRAARCARRCATSSPTTGRSCSARSRSTRFIVLVATGIYLTFFFDDSTRADDLPRHLRAARRRRR